MAPRFVNPHLVSQSIEHVSRAALDAIDSDSGDAPNADVNNGWMIMELEKLIKSSIDPGLHNLSSNDSLEEKAEAVDASSTRRRKRRRLEHGAGAEVGDESIPAISPGTYFCCVLTSNPNIEVYVLVSVIHSVSTGISKVTSQIPGSYT